MTHRKRTLATLSAAVAVLGTAACSHQNNPPHYSAYGPALGAGSGYVNGPETQPTPGTVAKAPPPMPTSAENVPYVAPSPYAPATGSTRGEDGAAATSSPAPVTWGSGPAAQGATEGQGVTNQMAGVPDVSTLSDAQLAAVVQTINMGEIQEGQLALSKSTSPDVKRFARDMIGAHRDMMNKTTAILTRLQITPNDNAVSNQLKSDTQSELQDLQSMRGKDFDRDYIDAQVRNHNKALELVDRIAPEVKNPEFKAALMSDRPKIRSAFARRGAGGGVLPEGQREPPAVVARRPARAAEDHSAAGGRSPQPGGSTGQTARVSQSGRRRRRYFTMAYDRVAYDLR